MDTKDYCAVIDVVRPKPSLLSNSALAAYFNLLMPVYFKGLKFLVRICTDLGLKDVQDYAQKLKKAEKAREMKQQVTKKF